MKKEIKNLRKALKQFRIKDFYGTTDYEAMFSEVLCAYRNMETAWNRSKWVNLAVNLLTFLAGFGICWILFVP